MLTWEELQVIVEVADKRFKQIKEKYAKLKPYLVFSSTAGQVEISGAGKTDVLDEFPDMVANSAAKSQAMELMKIVEVFNVLGPRSRISEAACRKAKETLAAIEPQLRYEEDVNIEVRFKVLKYDLIWELKTDPLVDAELTRQENSSIRIVLLNVNKTCQEKKDGVGTTCGANRA